MNRTEAIALIAAQLHEFIRDGRHSVAELMDLGKKMLGRRHVLGQLSFVLFLRCGETRDMERADGVESVPEGIHDIQVEGTFPVRRAVLCGIV